MALIKCKECKAEISNKAIKCPSCGAPVVPELQKILLGGCLVVVVVFVVVFLFVSISSKDYDNTDAALNQQKCKNDDLACWGDDGLAYASTYCKPQIEKLATHDVKWRDNSFGIIFSQYRWKDQAAKTITYIGDSALFQNGFGAYTPVSYECDVLIDNKTVTDARVREGRLP